MESNKRAYLQITLDVADANREAVARVYTKYKEPFLKMISGATSKELLIRDEDVQVLHGFANVLDAKAYLDSDLFNKDVVTELKSLLKSDPEIRIYDTI